MAKLLLRQQKIVLYHQLIELGMTPGKIRWRLGHGEWQRVMPRVIATFSGALTRRQQIIAAALYAGPLAQIAGLTALELHGCRYAPGDPAVHLLVPHGRQLTGSRRVQVRRTRRLDAGAWPLGVLTVCNPARAVVDAMLGTPTIRTTRAVVAEVVQRRMTTVVALHRELESAPRKGSAVLRQVLAEIADGIRSAPEAELRIVVSGSEILPVVRWNPVLSTESGRSLPTPDGYIEEAGLILEVDSREFHLGADGWAATLERTNRWAAAGLVVIHVRPSEIREQPLRVLAEIERAYAVRVGVQLKIRVDSPSP